MCIDFIDGNEGDYNYVGLICSSMVCYSMQINSAHNVDVKSAWLYLALLQFSYLHYIINSKQTILLHVHFEQQTLIQGPTILLKCHATASS